MILLLGGTSETAGVATALAQAGLDVLVSTASGVPLAVGSDARIRRRAGPLDASAMADLVRREGVRAIVDASHPYANRAHAAARQAAAQARVPCFALVRPSDIAPDDASVLWADDHEQAARIACSLGRGVLLTTGSRNLACYVEEARRAHVALAARVLDEPDSGRASLAAGIEPENILTGRGPFGVDANREHIRRCGAGVIVTKDSGQAGGVQAKLQAARLEGCQVVVVRRPPPAPGERTFERVEELVAAVVAAVQR